MDELTPMTRDDLAASLRGALLVAKWRPRAGFVPPHEADRERAALANRLADALLLGNVKPFKGPPAPRHSTPKPRDEG